ncbi:MAG TPA: hypothetical protein VFE74_03475 [Ramlibacter sp.]|nr:hypothetical protein [Ramlibacter sp.]
MQIHQMSVTYLPEQDRILMRINTTEGEEMRMWLTRRLLAGLWPLLTKLLTEHLLKLESAGASLAGANAELKKMLADFRKEEFLQHADFDTPYHEGQQRLPLGEEPLLVTDVDATPLASGPLRLNFNERPPNGDAKPRSFQMEMQPKLMQGLMHLLDQAMLQSQWREPFVAASASEAAIEDGERPRSRYLQ